MSVSVLKLITVVEDLNKIIEKLEQIVKQLSSDLPKIESKISLVATERTLKELGLAVSNIKQSIDLLSSIVQGLSKEQTLQDIKDKINVELSTRASELTLKSINETLDTKLSEIVNSINELKVLTETIKSTIETKTYTFTFENKSIDMEIPVYGRSFKITIKLNEDIGAELFIYSDNVLVYATSFKTLFSKEFRDIGGNIIRIYIPVKISGIMVVSVE